MGWAAVVLLYTTGRSRMDGQLGDSALTSGKVCAKRPHYAPEKACFLLFPWPNSFISSGISENVTRSSTNIVFLTC